MRYRDSQLIGLSVQTQSGRHVGRLTGFVIESDSHEIIQYTVKKSGTIGLIIPKELLVNRSQVLSIGEDKMVVDDGVVKEKASSKENKVAESAANNFGVTRSME